MPRVKEFYCGEDVKVFSDVPIVNKVFKDITERFINGITETNLEKKSLSECIEVSRDINLPYVNLNLLVKESDGSHYWINGYYETQFGELYSITDNYDDTYGFWQDDISNETLKLIDALRRENNYGL